MFTNKRHAETYKRILKEAEAGGGGREAEIDRARRVWSQGFVAEAIDAFCRTNEVMDVSGRPHKGVLTAHDMATWLPTIEDPVHLDYGAYRVLKPHAWTQGPVLLQMLALLKGFDLDRMSPTDPEFIHIWAECAKLAYADREAFYGDPKFVEVPMETLLSEAYNAERRKLVGERASMEQRPGTIDGYGGRVVVKAARALGAGAGEPTFARINTGHGADEQKVGRDGRVIGDTVHIDVIDKHGNMFTSTPSGGWLQSSPVIPEPRLPARHARADVLAGGRTAGLAGARQAAALDAFGRHGPARRQALHELGHARRRPAGPVELPVLPAPRAQSGTDAEDEHAGGHRRAGLAHRALPALVLAAHGTARRAGGRGPAAARRPSRIWSGAATRSRSAPTGRKDA